MEHPQDIPALPPPRYEHDGEESTYLGRYDQFDLYFDPQTGLFPTVIARHGDGSQYVSGIAQANHLLPLRVARGLAEARELLPARSVMLDGKAIDALIPALLMYISDRNRDRAICFDDDQEAAVDRELDYLCDLRRRLIEAVPPTQEAPS